MTPQQIKDEEADIQKRMCQAQYPLGVLLIEKETRTEYDKAMKEMIEDWGNKYCDEMQEELKELLSKLEDDEVKE